MNELSYLADAQVKHVYPDTFELGVVFPKIQTLTGVIRVKCLPQGFGNALSGSFVLPEVGDFGMVAFSQHNPRSGVWISSKNPRLWNCIPFELLTEDPQALVTIHRDSGREIHFSNGDVETLHADGTVVRVSASKDGSVSNTTRRAQKTPLKRTVGKDDRSTERVPLPEPSGTPVDIHIAHSSGFKASITADGSLAVETPKGHKFKLHDATEKSRDPHSGGVTGTPEEDAQRVVSQVILESEVGHKITFNDDPILQVNRYLSVRSSLGHEVFMKDKPDVDQFVRVTTKGGHTVLMRDKPALDSHITASSKEGQLLELRDTPTKQVRLLNHLGYGLIISDTGVHFMGPEIIHEGIVRLGGPDAVTPVVQQGDVDSRGDTQGSSSVTVFVK